MKKLLIACLLCVGTLSACQPVGPLPSAQTTLLDEKALYAAEAAYNVPANAYVAADDAGVLDDATKARVRPLMAHAYAALKLARSAYAVGDAESFAAQIGLVNDFVAQANMLLAKEKGPEGP